MTLPVRRSCVRICLFTGFIALVLLSNSVRAEEPHVTLIEENWEVVLNEPDQAINSPQIAFFMHPDSENQDVYFQMQLNYAAEEGYSSGGFRVGAFQNEVPLDEERSRVRDTLCWDNDRITWTSVMAAFEGKLYFAVKNGHGSQWGNFGGPEYLVEMPDEGISDMDEYDAQTRALFTSA